MTRDQQRQIKAEKKAAKIQARINAREEKKQDRQDLKNWNKMVERAKLKGAWIEN